MPVNRLKELLKDYRDSKASPIGFMLEKVKELLGIKFVKDTLFLQAGEFITKIVSIPFGIILARLLHPEGLGLYSLAFAVLGLIGVIGNLGVGDAGINRLAKAYAARDAEEIGDILSFVLKMMLLMTVVVFTVGMIIAPYISKAMYQNAEIGLFVQVLLLTMPLAILFGLSNIIFQSTRNMKTLAISESLKQVITPPIVVIGVLLGFGVMGAISGNVIATAVGILIASTLYFRLRSSNLVLPPFREMLLKRVKIAKFKEYFKFSFLIAIDKNIGRFYSLLPVLFLGTLFPPEEVGYFRVALGVVSIPVFLVSAVSRNLAAKIPEVYASGDIKELRNIFFKTTKYSGLISFGSTAVLLLVAPYAIRIFYGAEYIPAINIMYVLGIYSAVVGLGVALGPLYRTLNKVNVAIYINLASLAISLPIGWLAIRETGAIGSAILLVCFYLISVISALVYFTKIMK